VLLLLLLLCWRGRLLLLAIAAGTALLSMLLPSLQGLPCGRHLCHLRAGSDRGRLQAPQLIALPEVLPMHYAGQLSSLRLQGAGGGQEGRQADV